MLACVVQRLLLSKLIDQVAIATTDRPADDEIELLCQAEGWPCFRGNETDVLDRYYHAARGFDADLIARVTSDCPMIDPAVVDLAVATFTARCPSVDYVSNCQRRTFPRGLDIEVFSMGALARAWQEDTRPEWREHVTPYLYKSDGFRLAELVNTVDYSDLRWTVDTAEDLDLVRTIYQHFGHPAFRWQDVIEAMNGYPEWRAINSMSVQKPEP